MRGALDLLRAHHPPVPLPHGMPLGFSAAHQHFAFRLRSCEFLLYRRHEVTHEEMYHTFRPVESSGRAMRVL
jgi:hypothetical protein